MQEIPKIKNYRTEYLKIIEKLVMDSQDFYFVCRTPDKVIQEVKDWESGYDLFGVLSSRVSYIKEYLISFWSDD